jgi:hypothetical protein
VTAPNEKWESIGAFMRRVGLRNDKSLAAAMDTRLGRGKTLPTRRSEKGQLIEICSNANFDAFAVRNKAKTTEGN